MVTTSQVSIPCDGRPSPFPIIQEQQHGVAVMFKGLKQVTICIADKVVKDRCVDDV